MRLTINTNSEYGYELKADNPNTSLEQDVANAIQKLGQLEDIEEELGIDLVTLFKALKEPVYVIVNNKIVETYCGHIGEECKTIDFEIDGKDYKNLYDVETFYVLTKDYGKTWALTREELEK